MAVGVEGQHFPENEVLDLHESPAGGDVIGIDQRLVSERAVDLGITPDQARSQGAEDVRSRQTVAERSKQPRPWGGIRLRHLHLGPL